MLKLIAAIMFITWTIVVGITFVEIYGFESIVKPRVVSPTADKAIVYVLHGKDYKQKENELPHTFSFHLNVAKGTPAKVCAFDPRNDEETFVCKHITIDQKTEGFRLRLNR